MWTRMAFGHPQIRQQQGDRLRGHGSAAIGVNRPIAPSRELWQNLPLQVFCFLKVAYVHSERVLSHGNYSIFPSALALSIASCISR